MLVQISWPTPNVNFIFLTYLLAMISIILMVELETNIVITSQFTIIFSSTLIKVVVMFASITNFVSQYYTY